MAFNSNPGGPRHEAPDRRGMLAVPPPPPTDLMPHAGTAVDEGRVVAMLSALGQEIRLDLWRLLAEHGSEGLAAGVIAARLSLAPSSLSFHLQQLTQAGLLVHRRSSRRIIYAANRAMMHELLGFLSQTADAAGD
ncbi:MAG: hypothetical protein BGO51_23155 [Rhodospirillales bacterium 69-11]|nr:MAG: hypothetical protein BGO51_23155 [Rhodospirillales bacterium 69-11]